MNLIYYFEIGEGAVPIVLSCAHGGFKKPKRIPDKQDGVQIADKNTYFIAKQIFTSLRIKTIKIFYILNKIHRSKIDLNRPPKSVVAFNQSSNEARNIHYAYHDQLIRFAQECVKIYDRCLIIDLHGFTKPNRNYPDIILGHVFGNTLDIHENLKKQDCNRYWGCSQLYQEISESFTLDDGLALTDFNLAYSGGYITQKFFNKPKISAIQFEIAKYIRLDFNLTKKLIQAIVIAIVNSLK